ncbi:MAG: LysM peptidoglycan-binding domain-containing protein [Clostridiales bacterium]|nr:LysM peptidoglycan-binding domain-containing protein [Clostridiales bacterium]
MIIGSKKRLSLLLVLTMVVTLVFAPVAGVYADADSVVITIVHTNDTHSRVDAGIGFAKVATKIKEVKEANPNTLVIDAGDTLHGQTFATISKGESIIGLMNAMGYDVMTPGNHDFNYGQERLLELAGQANFPIITANLIKKDDGTPLMDPYVIKEIGGLKIGIFGLSTPETAYKTNPLNVEGLTFANPAEISKKMVEELKAKGVNAIIALAHLGIDKESTDTSYSVRNNVKGIDLIIDGHSHTLLGDIDNEGKDTIIVSTGEYTNNLGIVNLKFENGELKAIEPSLYTKDDAAELKEDEEVAALMNETTEKNKVITSVVVGKTDVILDGERAQVRGGETNLSNLITDAMLNLTGADIAITNGGGIRASIQPGEITMGDIITVLPFGNYVVVKEYTGDQVLKALEHGTASYPDLAGSFAQVAGLTYTLDLNQEAGKRVKDVKVKGAALDLNKKYKVATNDFMAVGGDDYTMFMDGELVLEMGGLDEILLEYVKSLDAIPAAVQPRMSVVEKKEEVLTETYTVKLGDVLWKIAEKFGLAWEKLAEYNALKDPHLIFPEQKLMIPAN